MQNKVRQGTNVTLKEIRSAAGQIRGSIVDTPCVPSRRLSEITGAEVRLKLENLQSTGSFKVRGALVKMLSLTSEERQRGVVAMSAGNHAQAVAFHAQRLGIPAVIVMPCFTPSVKQEQTRRFGAEVILHGESVSEAGTLAQQIGAERNLVFLHPYDDPRIIAGQGTIGLEIMEKESDLDDLVVPIGGGGLISGIATAAKALKPDVRVIGVETARFPSMRCALAGEQPRFGRFSIAEGIAIKVPGEHTLPIVRERVDDILLVEEELIEKSVLLLLEVEKTVTEGAGAVGLAALLAYPERFAGRKVGIVISGGNIDLPILSSIIQRGLVHTGRLVRLSVEIRDVPGELAKAAQCVADNGANVVQVNHQRIFTELPVQSTELQFVLQTRGPEHVREIVAALERMGYRALVKDGSRA
jgi:threonine dehydratase